MYKDIHIFKRVRVEMRHDHLAQVVLHSEYIVTPEPRVDWEQFTVDDAECLTRILLEATELYGTDISDRIEAADKAACVYLDGWIGPHETMRVTLAQEDMRSLQAYVAAALPPDGFHPTPTEAQAYLNTHPLRDDVRRVADYHIALAHAHREFLGIDK